MKKVLSIVGGVVAVLGVLVAVDAFFCHHKKKYLPDEVEAEIYFGENSDNSDPENDSTDGESGNKEKSE